MKAKPRLKDLLNEYLGKDKDKIEDPNLTKE
jgi:hypothetical protein